MREVHQFLTSLAQALAKMSLYAEGHPARLRAADASFTALEALQRQQPHLAFSFLGEDVILGNSPIRDMHGWDWGRRLAAAGVQRMEFVEQVTSEAWRDFLADVLRRLAATHGNAPRVVPRTPFAGTEAIRYGSLGVDVAGRVEAAEEPPQADSDGPPDLSAEADAVEWMHACVSGGGAIPLLEAELVVQSLANAMHAGQRIVLPLLQLKEFDQYTTTHSLNVSVLAMALAERMGLSSREVMQYGMAGLLHDLGKVKVPKEILRKPGTLTPEESAVMRSHPTEGARIILAHDHRLDLCATVAFEHHIMINGSGYPVRQRRCDCHAASMLVHVCDVYDALRTNRPYRVAWESGAILSYMGDRVGVEFEPTVARSFIGMVRELEPTVAHADAIDGVPVGA